MVYNTGMSENEKKKTGENFLTGFLHALQYLTEILFFYGTGALMYGFWNGITGGYLALFAGMVLSGSLLLHLLVQILERKHEITEQAEWISRILEGILYSLAVLSMDVRAGAVTLTGCAVILILRKLTENQQRDVLLRICGAAFSMLSLCMIPAMLQRNIITLADGMMMAAGSMLFCLEDFRIPSAGRRKKEFLWKKQILSAVLASGRDSFFMASLACLTPVIYQILNQKEKIHQMAGYRNVVICGCLALVFELVLYFTEKKQNHSPYESAASRAAALILTGLCASLFLMHASVMIGLIDLLVLMAVPAGVFLLKQSGHESVFSVKLLVFLLSWIGLFLVMMTSFQIYDGIYVDYSAVLMAYLLCTAEVILLDEICHYLPSDPENHEK